MVKELFIRIPDVVSEKNSKIEGLTAGQRKILEIAQFVHYDQVQLFSNPCPVWPEIVPMVVVRTQVATSEDSDSRSSSLGVSHLIAQARTGSADALGRLLEGCRRYLLFSARKSLDSDLRPKGGASDLVQDTFTEAQKDFCQFRGTTEQELLAWLVGILNNRLANHTRSYRHTLKRDICREVALEMVAAGNIASDPSSAEKPSFFTTANVVRLQESLSHLPEAMQQVLVLRTWERRSFVEIATIMRGTPDSVRKMWGRAVQRLRVEFSKQS